MLDSCYFDLKFWKEEDSVGGCHHCIKSRSTVYYIPFLAWLCCGQSFHRVWRIWALPVRFCAVYVLVWTNLQNTLPCTVEWLMQWFVLLFYSAGIHRSKMENVPWPDCTNGFWSWWNLGWSGCLLRKILDSTAASFAWSWHPNPCGMP
jgi:hypothetical protein